MSEERSLEHTWRCWRPVAYRLVALGFPIWLDGAPWRGPYHVAFYEAGGAAWTAPVWMGLN